MKVELLLSVKIDKAQNCLFCPNFYQDHCVNYYYETIYSFDHCPFIFITLKTRELNENLLLIRSNYYLSSW